MSTSEKQTSLGSAVVVMAYGGPVGLDEVAPFLRRVLAPREPPAAMIDRAMVRYRAIGGGSPLLANTVRQAKALEERLRREADPGEAIPVFVGMRFTEPTLESALHQAVVHATGGTVAAVIMASHQSARATGAYRMQVERLCTEWREGGSRPSAEVVFVDGWQRSTGYVRAVAERVTQARDRLGAGPDASPPWLLFTAHSLPVDPEEGDPVYEAALGETAAAVAALTGSPRWRLGYQSRSDRPGSVWLGPDAAAVLADEAAAGRRPVIVVPLGFVAEHLETLYDLDIALRAEADRLGVPMERAGTVQDHPSFIEALAEAVLRCLQGTRPERSVTREP